MLSFFFSSSLNSMVLGLTRMGGMFIKLSEAHAGHWLGHLAQRFLAFFFCFALVFLTFGLTFFVGAILTTSLPRGYMVKPISQTSTLVQFSSSVAIIFSMHGLPQSGHLLT